MKLVFLDALCLVASITFVVLDVFRDFHLFLSGAMAATLFIRLYVFGVNDAQHK